MASIPDNYEINVAKKVKDYHHAIHFCRIELPSYSEEDAVSKLNTLRQLFGNEYILTMTHWICRGEHRNEWKGDTNNET